MFNKTEQTLLIDALDMALNSNKRAKNTKHRKEFDAIYDKIETEINELKTKINNIK